MTDNTDSRYNVEASRLTVATAVDFLREYENELRQSGAEGKYTREVSKTIEKLNTALEKRANEKRSNNEDS